MTKSHSNNRQPAYDRPTPARPDHALILRDTRVHRGQTADDVQNILDSGTVSQHKKRAVERGYAVKNHGPRYADVNESIPVLGDVFARGTVLGTHTPTMDIKTPTSMLRIGYVASNAQRADSDGNAHATANETLDYNGQRVNWVKQIKSVIVQKASNGQYTITASTLKNPRLDNGKYASKPYTIVRQWNAIRKPDILSQRTADRMGINATTSTVIDDSPILGPHVKPWEVE